MLKMLCRWQLLGFVRRPWVPLVIGIVAVMLLLPRGGRRGAEPLWGFWILFICGQFPLLFAMAFGRDMPIRQEGPSEAHYLLTRPITRTRLLAARLMAASLVGGALWLCFALYSFRPVLSEGGAGLEVRSSRSIAAFEAAGATPEFGDPLDAAKHAKWKAGKSDDTSYMRATFHLRSLGYEFLVFGLLVYLALLVAQNCAPYTGKLERRSFRSASLYLRNGPFVVLMALPLLFIFAPGPNAGSFIDGSDLVVAFIYRHFGAMVAALVAATGLLLAYAHRSWQRCDIRL